MAVKRWQFLCFLLFGTHAVGKTVASTVRISRCEVCDDDTPGKECSNRDDIEGANCLGSHPYCGTRITVTGGTTKVWKGCASEQTCINDWWLATSTNTACSQAAVTSGHVTSGTTCTFCCHEESPGGLYCNDELYPEYLSQFPGVTAGPTVTAPVTQVTTTQVTTTPVTTPVTTSHVTTAPVTTITTTGKTPDNRCPVCVSDTTTGQTCDETNSLDFCGPSTPYCMTSFYRQPSGYRVAKRCASHDDCVLLWLIRTMTNSACVTHNLSAGSGNHMECHFCCRNPVAGNVCNMDDQHIIPQYLMGGGNTLSTTTSSTTTDHPSGHGHNQSTWDTQPTAPHSTTPGAGPPDSTAPTTAKHAMPCIACVTDSTSGEQCDESNQFDVCHHTSLYCMTSFYRTPAAYRIVKRCATRDDCERLYWTSTTNKTECVNLNLSPGTGSQLECHYCCFSPDPAVTFCNDDHSKVIPRYLISMAEDTRTSPTNVPTTTATTTTPLPTTTTTTTTTTTPSTPMPTSPVSGSRCQVCLQDPNSQQFCMDNDFQTCGGQDEFFCLNTVTFSAANANGIGVSKTCATQSVCQSAWYDKTRHVPECLQQHPSPAAGQSELTCSYCCNASDITGTPCNIFDKPADLVDFDIPTTTPQPTTTTTTTTPTTTAANVMCAVCDMCAFFQQEQTCSSGFCMTSVTDDDFFSRVVTKSCVTEDECYSRWWQQTSKQSGCMAMMSNGSQPTGTSMQCNFCCYGDKCNSPDFPAQNTLYDGDNKGQYSVG